MKRNPKASARAPILPGETIELADRKEMLITGVRGIGAYSREHILLYTVRGTVQIHGGALTLCWAGEKRLMLRGRIVSLTLEREAT